MKLYGSYTSPFVRHCRIALAQGGHDYEFVEADHSMSAEISPTRKVPFMHDGERLLTDSSSILKHVRALSGREFLAEVEDLELFAMTNTVLDATINLFLLENNGLKPEQIPYLQRQQDRVQSGVAELNDRIRGSRGIESDSELRCACFVDWAIFRNRVDFTDYPNLSALRQTANQQEVFSRTAPPGA